MPKEMDLRSMPDGQAMASMAVDAKDSKGLSNVTAHETPDTVTADNPSKEYVTGSGKPAKPYGATGRLG